jgi:hypothetical protein
VRQYLPGVDLRVALLDLTNEPGIVVDGSLEELEFVERKICATQDQVFDFGEKLMGALKAKDWQS